MKPSTKQVAKKRPSKVDRNPLSPLYGFVNIYFVDERAGRIVNGNIESINCIIKPEFDFDKKITGRTVNFYYSVRTDVQVERINLHEEHLHSTHAKASLALGKLRTDFLLR